MLGNKIDDRSFGVSDNNAARYRPAHDDVIDQDVKIEGMIRPIFNKIVLIMDESVRGDYVLSNEGAHSTTPFLNTADHLINFGVAISSSNCSTVSRMITRFGMRRSDLPDGWQEGLRRPTFWKFAQKAGYKTLHIDAWGNPIFYHSGFSAVENALIDYKINVIENPAYLRDHTVARKLLTSLKEEAPAFIYVDKFGVHLPYFNKYPPALQKPSTSPIAELAEQEVMVSHYQTAIHWSVDEFFRELLPTIDLSKTLIIYTSDHGQSLKAGKQSHCTSTPNVPPAEAYVPILAFTSEPKFKRLLTVAATNNFNRFSHFEIFPTLLLAMGFDPNWVNKTYGPSLKDLPPSQREFLIGSPLYQPMMVPTESNFGRTWPRLLGEQK
jgi:glucan phosphoethanolaminetransferase (alkaline phosphatase superfamily)